MEILHYVLAKIDGRWLPDDSDFSSIRFAIARIDNSASYSPSAFIIMKIHL